MAALDIGTNSFHLVVARPVGGDRFETLTREKEVVRLGHGGGDMKVLTAEAIDRGIACLRGCGGSPTATTPRCAPSPPSAVREAANARQFLDRARDEAGIDIEVISGVEEARLIHLGVLQAVPVFDRRLLLVDIGGGSTELLIGERGETLAARSFKLGAVRLTDRFFPGGEVTAGRRHGLPRRTCAASSALPPRASTTHGFEVAVASSGTAEAIARIVHAATGAEPLRTYNCFEFTARGARRRRRRARQAPHRRRRRAKVAGLEPGAGRHHRRRRADPGDGRRDVRRRAFTFSEAALREGVLARHDQPATRRVPEVHHLRDVSRRSIRQLAERCDDDPAHSAHVARLAVELFDAHPRCTASARRPGSTSRPARCSPTSASSSPTASTTCTPTT